MNVEEIIEYMKTSKKSTITESEIRKLYIDAEYSELAGFIAGLVEEGRLKHKKKEKTNGMNPSMYMEYRLVKEKEDYSEVKKEIMLLNSDLDYRYYLERPKEYIKDREYIQMVNYYFNQYRGRLDEPMSINERAYDIWDKEKFIKGNRTKGSGEENGIGKKILKNLGLTYEKLNVYDTPEPFFYYPNDRSINNILIIENKDTWHTARKILKEGQDHILGFKVGLLIFGEGKKIKSSIDFLHDEEFEYIKNPTIMYWGDIDFTGIDIFYSLKEKSEADLFTPAYLLMIDRAKNVKELEDMKDQKERKHIDEFLENFDDAHRKFLTEMLEDNKYIPQEILNYQVLKKCDYI